MSSHIATIKENTKEKKNVPSDENSGFALLVMVERSDRMWSTGEGNGKSLQYSFLEDPMNSMKRQKDRTLEDELPRLVGAQYLLQISREITPE